MKNDSISAGMFMAIGFLCVAIVIAVLLPVVRDVIGTANRNRPAIPAAIIQIDHNVLPVLRLTSSYKEVA